MIINSVVIPPTSLEIAILQKVTIPSSGQYIQLHGKFYTSIPTKFSFFFSKMQVIINTVFQTIDRIYIMPVHKKTCQKNSYDFFLAKKKRGGGFKRKLETAFVVC